MNKLKIYQHIKYAYNYKEWHL